MRVGNISNHIQSYSVTKNLKPLNVFQTYPQQKDTVSFGMALISQEERDKEHHYLELKSSLRNENGNLLKGEKLADILRRISEEESYETNKRLYLDDEMYLSNVMDAENLKEMNRALRNHPELLERIYTYQNNGKGYPAASYDAFQLEAMDEALKDKPELLIKIYSSSKQDSYTLIHNPIIHTFSAAALREMNRALKDHPEALLNIYQQPITLKQKSDTSKAVKCNILDFMDSKEKLDVVNEALLEQYPEELAKLYLGTVTYFPREVAKLGYGGKIEQRPELKPIVERLVYDTEEVSEQTSLELAKKYGLEEAVNILSRKKAGQEIE